MKIKNVLTQVLFILYTPVSVYLIVLSCYCFDINLLNNKIVNLDNEDKCIVILSILVGTILIYFLLNMLRKTWKKQLNINLN